MSPEAGWYADPTDPTAVRWWDGSSWSTQTRAAPRELAMAGAPVASGSVAAESSLPPVVTVTAPPAPTPAAAPTPTTAPTPAPVAEMADEEPVDRSRPGARRALPPLPEPTPEPAAAETEDVDRSRPGARRALPPEVAVAAAAAPAAPVAAPRPVSAPAAPPAPWVDSAATPALGGPGFGGAAPVGFGSAAPTGFGSAPAGHGTAPNGFGGSDFGPVHQGSYHAARSWKVPAAIAVVTVLLLGAGVAVGVPKYRDAKAQATAAQAPDVLVHTAPRALAGQKKFAVPGFAATSQQLTDSGAQWAWAQAYGTRDAVTLYVGSDVAPSMRAEAVRALTSHDAATTMLTEISGGITDGSKGQAVAGTPAEYASPVGGKAWCMPMTVSGVAGGYCLWTNGKELLEVLSLPGLEQVAAKSMMTSLTQMATVVTKASATAGPLPTSSAS